MLRSRSLPLHMGLLCLPLLLPACGAENPGGSSDTASDSDSVDSETGADTSNPATTEATSQTSAGPSGSQGETDSSSTDGSSSTTDDSASDTDTDTDTETTGDPGPIYDGDPLPEAPPGEWNWVDFPEAKCIDGTKTGIGVRYGLSDKVVIFFEGGGGCFNDATCGLFYASFAHFDELVFDVIWQNTILQGGIFSTNNSDNPVRDWNFIYVPYCTGDVHAGDSPDTFVPGYLVDEPQQFVGYRNFGHFLQRIVPTFEDTSHVLVTGISAGGFGAAFNYDRVADAFGEAKVSLIDDSGPPLTDPWLVPCMQTAWRELYNLDMTLPQDCEGCFADDGGGIYNLAHFLAEKHHDQSLGLITAERDVIIRTFFGYGIQNEGGEHCPDGIFELPMNGGYFEEGIYALRDELGNSDVWGSYIMGGITHTYLSFPDYYLKQVNGIRLVDWVRNHLEGNTSHVSP